MKVCLIYLSCIILSGLIAGCGNDNQKSLDSPQFCIQEDDKVHVSLITMTDDLVELKITACVINPQLVDLFPVIVVTHLDNRPLARSLENIDSIPNEIDIDVPLYGSGLVNLGLMRTHDKVGRTQYEAQYSIKDQIDGVDLRKGFSSLGLKIILYGNDFTEIERVNRIVEYDYISEALNVMDTERNLIGSAIAPMVGNDGEEIVGTCRISGTEPQSEYNPYDECSVAQWAWYALKNNDYDVWKTMVTPYWYDYYYNDTADITETARHSLATSMVEELTDYIFIITNKAVIPESLECVFWGLYDQTDEYDELDYSALMIVFKGQDPGVYPTSVRGTPVLGLIHFTLIDGTQANPLMTGDITNEGRLQDWVEKWNNSYAISINIIENPLVLDGESFFSAWEVTNISDLIGKFTFTRSCNGSLKYDSGNMPIEEPEDLGIDQNEECTISGTEPCGDYNPFDEISVLQWTWHALQKNDPEIWEVVISPFWEDCILDQKCAEMIGPQSISELVEGIIVEMGIDANDFKNPECVGWNLTENPSYPQHDMGGEILLLVAKGQFEGQQTYVNFGFTRIDESAPMFACRDENEGSAVCKKWQNAFIVGGFGLEPIHDLDYFLGVVGPLRECDWD